MKKLIRGNYKKVADKEAHPEIPWNKIYGLRNHIIHDYKGVNLELVWQIIEGDLPDLNDKLKSL